MIQQHLPNASNHLGNEPRIMALAAIGIFVLAVGAYLHWLKASRWKKREASRAMKIIAVPAALAVGLGMLILPVLFAPAFESIIWLAFLIAISFLSIVLILNPKTRRSFIK
ncbi:MAG: hypothetical protein ACRDHZ_17010 [Ktedonobacteraceae bacterium]